MASLKNHIHPLRIIAVTVILFLTSTLFTFTAVGQQSSAETVASLQSRFAQDHSGLVELLNKMADSPDQLIDGSVASALSNLQSELDTLSNQVDGARSIIDGKMNLLRSNQELPTSDKEILGNELNKQLAPISDLKSSIASLRGKVDYLISTQLPKWQQSYKSYADIMGSDRAREKLHNSVREFVVSLDKKPAVTPKQKR